MINIYDKITELRKSKLDFSLCTIVSTKGSTPRKVGAKMLVLEDGRIFGTVGGGAFEKFVIKNAIEQIKIHEPKLFRHDLLHQHGMCCGGTIDVYIEPTVKKNTLYIFGAGHTGHALAKYAVNFNFQTVLIDDRKEYLADIDVPDLNKMHLPFGEALKLLPFDEHTYICIMTYGHSLDRNILSFCLKKPFAYLGMIGSHRKVEMTKKIFSAGLNISDEDLQRIDMPMGIDIDAEGPEEIALSILSKLIAVKNKVTLWEKELQL